MQNAGEVGTGAASAVGGIAVKSAPPVAVSGLSLAGVQMQDWVYIATLLWIAIQAGVFLWDRFGKKRRTTSRGRK